MLRPHVDHHLTGIFASIYNLFFYHRQYFLLVRKWLAFPGKTPVARNLFSMDGLPNPRELKFSLNSGDRQTSHPAYPLLHARANLPFSISIPLMVRLAGLLAL